MVTWELPDGSEVRCEQLPVDAAALRAFVMRFMAAHPRAWDTGTWDVEGLATEFERQFGEPVDVEKVCGADGVTVHIVRPRLAASL
jgi:hypothetical protein